MDLPYLGSGLTVRKRDAVVADEADVEVDETAIEVKVRVEAPELAGVDVPEVHRDEDTLGKDGSDKPPLAVQQDQIGRMFDPYIHKFLQVLYATRTSTPTPSRLVPSGGPYANYSPVT